MSRQRTIIGVATGVALLAAAGLLIANRKRAGKRQYNNQTSDLADNYRSKLQNLQRKAKREYADVVSQGADVAERVGDITQKVRSSFQ